MFATFRQDIARLAEAKNLPPWRATVEGLLFDNGFQAVFLHRIAHGFKRRGWPVLGPLFGRLSIWLTGVEIAPGTEIGPGLTISHGTGIVIGQWARLGTDVTLLHQVTIGAASGRRVRQMPSIGDRVFIGAGAKVIGDITIGDGAFIGVNAVVSRDIPAEHKVIAGGGLTIQPPRAPDDREGASSS